MQYLLKNVIITVIISITLQISPTTTSRTSLTKNETHSLLEPLPTASTSINDWFKRLNDQYRLLSQIIAAIAWELSVHSTADITDDAVQLTIIKSQWRNLRCQEADVIKSQSQLNREYLRMIFLLCRGPKFTNFQASELNQLLGKIFETNTETEICLKQDFDICHATNHLWDNTYVRTAKGEYFLLVNNGHQQDSNFINPVIAENEQKDAFRCFKNEPDMEKIISGDFRPFGNIKCLLPRNKIFRWAWESVREAIGPPIGLLYADTIQIMNVGAQNNGYRDIGDVWREELEVPYLRSVIDKLMSDIKPLYTKLHAIVRHVLLDKYPNVPGFVRNGLIPADLFGNMYAQDWSSLIPDLILPYAEVDLNERIRATKWSPLDMVKRSEDLYTSMGLFPMTQEFWDHSIFDQSTNISKCHGSAANMFDDGDYRMIVCADKSLYDFYVIVHEMGHIEYYMGFVTQPAIFQDGTTTAFQEAIGDSIFTAMMTPQHLSRLGLIEDKYLYPATEDKFKHEYLCGTFCRDEDQTRIVNEIKEELGDDFLSDFEFLSNPIPDFDKINKEVKEKYNSRDSDDTSAFDITLLLHMALSKIPQIPFTYILDTLRWDLFNGNVEYSTANDYYWMLTERESGIKAPGPTGSRSGMFDAAVKFHFADNIPMIRYFLASFLQAQIFKGLCETTLYGKATGHQKLTMPLHRCDIYGSKKAGKVLKKALAMGSSEHWSEVLYVITGEREIKADALLEYYAPLDSFLDNLILKYNIPYGWLGPM